MKLSKFILPVQDPSYLYNPRSSSTIQPFFKTTPTPSFYLRVSRRCSSRQLLSKPIPSKILGCYARQLLLKLVSSNMLKTFPKVSPTPRKPLPSMMLKKFCKTASLQAYTSRPSNFASRRLLLQFCIFEDTLDVIYQSVRPYNDLDNSRHPHLLPIFFCN